MNNSDTILIIDDEVQIRRLLEITLSANGYKISEASNGKDGLIQAATTHSGSYLTGSWVTRRRRTGDSKKAQGMV